MVAWRKAAGNQSVTDFQSHDNATIAFCRGSGACIALNSGSSTWEATLHFALPAGKYCDVIKSDDSSSCSTVEVATDGTSKVLVPPLSAVALHINAQVRAPRSDSPIEQFV